MICAIHASVCSSSGYPDEIRSGMGWGILPLLPRQTLFRTWISSFKQESAKAISAVFSKQEEPKIEEQIDDVPEEFVKEEQGTLYDHEHDHNTPLPNIELEELFSFLIDEWAYMPDMLTTKQATDLTGYNDTTINKWAADRKIQAVNYYGKNLISKGSLRNISQA